MQDQRKSEVGMRPPAHRGLRLRPGGKSESPDCGFWISDCGLMRIRTRRRPIGRDYAAAKDAECGTFRLRNADFGLRNLETKCRGHKLGQAPRVRRCCRHGLRRTQSSCCRAFWFYWVHWFKSIKSFQPNQPFNYSTNQPFLPIHFPVSHCQDASLYGDGEDNSDTESNGANTADEPCHNG